MHAVYVPLAVENEFLAVVGIVVYQGQKCWTSPLLLPCLQLSFQLQIVTALSFTNTKLFCLVIDTLMWTVIVPVSLRVDEIALEVETHNQKLLVIDATPQTL